MAERPENVAALAVLAKMDAGLLLDAECWLGGGTAVSLRCGEFRISHDVDLLCASHGGYRLLRQRVFERGARGLFASDVEVLRELRADRYGIRTAVSVGGPHIKLEIVSEGRIRLEGHVEPTLPVRRLTDVDLVAEKLLANQDRFLDDASLGRDAIDLIMLSERLGGLPAASWEKARAAYGASVDVAWERALRGLRDRPQLLARWLDALAVLPQARAVIGATLASLPPDPHE